MLIAGLQKQGSNPQSRCWFVHKGTLKTPYGQVNNVKCLFPSRQSADGLPAIAEFCSLFLPNIAVPHCAAKIKQHFLFLKQQKL